MAECGLLSPSFVPPPEIRKLRLLTRYRAQLQQDRTRDAVRLELMLEDASIKLLVVASSLTTVSARAMLRAMIAGEADPAVLADMAKGKMRSKIPELTEALIGHFSTDHAALARTLLSRLDMVEAALEDLDRSIAHACQPWANQIELLQTIPGVGEKVAEVIVAETGADMTRFLSAAHLASWAGVCPAIYESAGKRTPAGSRRGNKWLTSMLVESAASVGRMTKPNYLTSRHRRIARHRGAGRANLATAHSILICAYYVLTRDEPYRDLGADWLSERDEAAHARRLVTQLQRLGYGVTLDKPAA